MEKKQETPPSVIVARMVKQLQDFQSKGIPSIQRKMEERKIHYSHFTFPTMELGYVQERLQDLQTLLEQREEQHD